MGAPGLKRKLISIWKAQTLGYASAALPAFRLDRSIPETDPDVPFPRGQKFDRSTAPAPAAVRFEECLLLPDGTVVTGEHYVFGGLTFVPSRANWRTYAPHVEDVRGDLVTLRLPSRTEDLGLHAYQLVTGHGRNQAHFFMDVLARSFLAGRLPASWPPLQALVCRTPAFPMQAWLLDRLLGAGNLVFQDKQAIRAKSCVVTSLPCGPDGALLEAIEHVRDLVRARAPVAPSAGRRRRIFVSRDDGAQDQGRVLANPGELDEVLAEHGFERLTLSRLGPEEQLAAFQQAECLLGVHGAGLMNLFLCDTRTKIVELHVPPPHPTPPWIARIGALLGMDYYVLPLVRRDGNTFVDAAALRSFLQRIAPANEPFGGPPAEGGRRAAGAPSPVRTRT